MPDITRRDLLASGITLSASSILARSAWARTAALLGSDTPEGSAATVPAVAPREQLLFDFGWKFTLVHGTDPAKDLGFGFGQGDLSKTGEFEFSKAGFDDSKWRVLNLPHDWAVELPFVYDDEQKSHGYKPLGRRYPGKQRGLVPAHIRDSGERSGPAHWVEFDGAFRDVLVFVNGCFIGRNDNGYAPFRFDLSDFLALWREELYCPARQTPASATGWFYEVRASIVTWWLTRTTLCIWASGTARCARQ